jgi:serine/threonine protein kinase
LTTGRPQVRLADFAAARVAGPRAEGAGLLSLAPEAVRREGGGAAADVWALGCLVWEMAVGAPPFSFEGVLRMAQASVQRVRRDGR